jgi:dihydroflavonol-4-reductase
MLELFLTGRSPFFLDCVLNLVDVRDLADGIVRAADRGRSGERYILGGDNVPLRSLLPSLQQLSGRSMPKRAIPPTVALAAGTVAEALSRVTGREPVPSREGVLLALRSAAFDSSKAKRELGYAPRPIDRALAEAVCWLVSRRAENANGVDGVASFSTKSGG